MGKAPAGGRSATAPTTFRAHDVDQLNHAVSGSELEVVQLRPGFLDVTVTQRSLDDLSIDEGFVNLPLRVRGRLDRRRYGIGLYTPGSRAIYNGHHLDSGRLLYFMPGRELNGHIQGPHGWISLIIPDAWIESIAHTSRRRTSLQLSTDCDVLRPEPQRLVELRLAADAIVKERSPAGANGDGWLTSHLRNSLGGTLSALDDLPGKEVSHTLAHFSTARRAERYMRERLDEPLCIDDVCIRLHVSRRYLEYAFSDAVGTSPSRYLRLLRLHEVRRCLKNPQAETTVTREALKFGFNHLSLFAVQYKKTFGESPSATLSSNRRPHTSGCSPGAVPVPGGHADSR